MHPQAYGAGGSIVDSAYAWQRSLAKSGEPKGAAVVSDTMLPSRSTYVDPLAVQRGCNLEHVAPLPTQPQPQPAQKIEVCRHGAAFFERADACERPARLTPVVRPLVAAGVEHFLIADSSPGDASPAASNPSARALQFEQVARSVETAVTAIHHVIHAAVQVPTSAVPAPRDVGVQEPGLLTASSSMLALGVASVEEERPCAPVLYRTQTLAPSVTLPTCALRALGAAGGATAALLEELSRENEAALIARLSSENARLKERLAHTERRLEELDGDRERPVTNTQHARPWGQHACPDAAATLRRRALRACAYSNLAAEQSL